MAHPFRSQTIANWVGDFCGSAEAARLPAGIAKVASPVLEAFMSAACARRDYRRAGRRTLGEAAARGRLHETDNAALALWLRRPPKRGDPRL